jgi:hypothetical protein
MVETPGCVDASLGQDLLRCRLWPALWLGRRLLKMTLELVYHTPYPLSGCVGLWLCGGVSCRLWLGVSDSSVS